MLCAASCDKETFVPHSRLVGHFFRYALRGDQSSCTFWMAILEVYFQDTTVDVSELSETMFETVSKITFVHLSVEVLFDPEPIKLVVAKCTSVDILLNFVDDLSLS